MARHYESTEALCPFYRGEEKTTIYCEGVAPGTTITLAFGRDAKDYKNAFCRKEWEACRVAAMLQKVHEN